MDHRCIGGPSLTETSLCGAYLCILRKFRSSVKLNQILLKCLHEEYFKGTPRRNIPVNTVCDKNYVLNKKVR
jgi:hypothetical protein